MESNPDFWEKVLNLSTNLGGIGILAAGTIWLLNKTWKDHVEVIKGFHELEKGRADKILDVVISNTTSTTANTSVLQSLHRRLDRDAYERDKDVASLKP